MRNPERNIYVLCRKAGYIPFLGICGPIANPLHLPAKLCLNIITAGITLYEFEPTTRDTLELTTDNIFEDDNFGVKSKVTEVMPKPNNAPIKNFGVSSSELNAKPNDEKPADVRPPVEEVKPEEKSDTGIKDSEPVKVTDKVPYKQQEKNKSYKK